MDYLDWNDRLASHFFSTFRAGQNIYLCLDRDLIVRIGQEADTTVDLPDFLKAVRTGPPWLAKGTSGVCALALDTIRGNWKGKREQLDYPPYFAYLALFVAAAGLEGDWSPNAYYPRLRTLLGEPATNGTYPGFDDMSWLWEDLEKWSNIDKGGQLGVFRHFLYGSWKHVGLPIAQTLLSEDDRRILPALFSRDAFDPQSPPNDDEFMGVLARSGEGLFRPRTLSLLRSSQSAGGANARQALNTLLLAELREWDGSVPYPIQSPEPPEAFLNSEPVASNLLDDSEVNSSGTLRLGCRFDPVSEKVSFHLRCKTPAEFPEDGFRFCLAENEIFKGSGTTEILGEEQGDGWSEPLKERSIHRVLDATIFDWSAPFRLQDEEQGWDFRWRGAPVRFLMDARSEGLSGYIEVFRLAQGVPVLIAVHPSLVAKVEDWGAVACRGWKRLPQAVGNLRNWVLFSAEAVSENAPTKAPLPLLCPASSVSILLRGGIRAGGGNRFFDFAPPQVELQGNGGLRLFCNERALARDDNGLFALPQTSDGAWNLEAKLADSEKEETVARLVIYSVQDAWNWRTPEPKQWFDAAGAPCQNGQDKATIAGSTIEATDLAPFHFGGVIPIMEGGTVHFIGRVPGQISCGTHRPQGWEPVWAIVSRRKGQAHFCALDASAATPLDKVGQSKRRDVKEWCEWLYNRRNDIAPPPENDLKELWKDYVATAKKLR